ncbi:MAG: DcrB-related protein [Armatimonadota bacterium]
MKLRLFLGLFVIVLVLFSAATAAQPAPPAKSTEYINAENGIKLTFPAGWKVTTNMGMVLVAGISPLEGAADTFRENLCVVVEALPEKMTLDAYANASVALMRKMFQNFAVVSDTPLTANGIPMKRLVYRCTMGEAKAVLHNVLYLFVREKQGFTFTGSARPESFNRCAPFFDGIAHSTNLFPPTPPARKTTWKDEGFSLAFPDDWTLKEKFMSTVVLGSSPKENEKDAFQENINVVAQELSNAASLNEVFTAGQAQYRAIFSEYHQVECRDVILASKSAKRLLATYRMGELQLEGLIYYLLDGKRLYVLTATATQESYSRYQEQFEKIMGTFTLTGKVPANTP